MPISALPAVTPSPTPGYIFHRMSLPVFLFCAVFATALGISRITILPALTSVEVGGVVRDAAGLKVQAEALEAKLAVLQKDRDAQILPLDGMPYRTLADQKIENPLVTDLLDTFRSIGKSVVPGIPDAIGITAAAYEASQHTLTLSGDVHGVGPSSMTILAQFTEMLRSDPRVQSLVAPVFVRLEDPKIGAHSPFTILLTLP